MNKFFLLIFLGVIATSCKEDVATITDEEIHEEVSAPKKTKVDSIIDQTKETHAALDFLNKEGAQFNIQLEFNGKERLNALLSMTTNTNKARLDLADGGVIIYDGNKVWSNWTNGTDAQARFDIFTWSYFFALPYKMDDPGTNVVLNPYPDDYHKVRLTFSENTGDTPDDWYDLYINSHTHLLEYAGYIVTYGGADQAEASKNAHAISYENYKSFDSIPVSLAWSFHNYSDTINREEKIGQAVLSQLIFGKLDDSLFQAKPGMHEVLLP